VDVSEFSGREPGSDFDIILEELRQFSEELIKKPMIVVASKVDACQDESRIEAVADKAKEHGYDFLAISSVTGKGIEDLRFAMSEKLFPVNNATISVGS
jgi:GTP-binding protein